MKTLIVYSQTQFGFDPVLPALLEALRNTGVNYSEASTIDADAHDGLPSHLVEVEFDAVICMDAIHWFFQNRTMLLGRPWVCVIAFSMRDVMELRHSISKSLELGIHAIFTSSVHFVSDTSAIHPTVYARRPSSIWTWQKPTIDRKWVSVFGCVLPNIEDRDFSQLLYVSERIKDPEELKIYVDVHEKQELPEALRQHRAYAENLFGHYDDFAYYIPAPRITDYRIGHPPYEILEAIERGCQPILVRHPIIPTLHELVSPQFNSLNDLDAAIDQAMFESLSIEMNSARKHMSQPADLQSQVWQAYARWRANNAPAS